MLRLCLPKLQRLYIFGCQQVSGTLRIDRDSLPGNGKLQALSLHRTGTVIFMPDSFTRLTALATLTLTKCGLVHIQAAVTGLAGSLTALSLPYNDGLQLAADDCVLLLTLKKLRALDLQKSCTSLALSRAGLAASPAASEHSNDHASMWSPRSLQHLVKLPGAFLAQHGHALALTTFVDWREESSSDSDVDSV